MVPGRRHRSAVRRAVVGRPHHRRVAGMTAAALALAIAALIGGHPPAVRMRAGMRSAHSWPAAPAGRRIRCGARSTGRGISPGHLRGLPVLGYGGVNRGPRDGPVGASAAGPDTRPGRRSPCAGRGSGHRVGTARAATSTSNVAHCCGWHAGRRPRARPSPTVSPNWPSSPDTTPPARPTRPPNVPGWSSPDRSASVSCRRSSASVWCRWWRGWPAMSSAPACCE